MIADTTFFIDLAHGDKNAVKKFEELHSKGEPIVVSAVTVYELWQGKHGLNRNEDLFLSKFEKDAFVVPIESEAAAEAGRIKSDLRKRGFELNPPDALIAGLCIIGNDVILTRNVKDFSRIEGLRIEAY